ncbi:hypothetical protein AC249_AIPGENE21105 [Exaiptasia diaphana]|nr:hypothetical protein AC249_AIPGENE21105 [Exaiptasia diaphana]
MTEKLAEYGSWVSPISSDLLVQKSISLQEIRIDPLDKGFVYWSEGLPEEGGRIVICKLKNGSKDFEVITPDGFYVRTTVHEYGGGAFIVHNKKVYFSNFEDQT